MMHTEDEAKKVSECASRPLDGSAEPAGIELVGQPGEHIARAADRLVAAAQERGASASMDFNEIRLVAHPGTTADEIVVDFDAKLKEASGRYRESPAGIAAAKKSEDERSALQGTHDALMRRLPSLNFKDDVAVLDWLCEMQDPSDRVGVIVRKDTVVKTFAKAGFQPGVNCGPDFRPESRDNVHRWIVGQALSGLESGRAIHSIIHKFAAEWKAKFAPSRDGHRCQ